MPPPTLRRGSSVGDKRHNKRTVSSKKGKTNSIKKEKTKYHKEKYAREQKMVRQRGGADHSHSASSSFKSRNNNDGRHQPKSARTKDIDIHLAAKVSSELRVDLANFKSKLNVTDLFGPELGHFFKFVPPPFVQQHLPEEVRPFRTYLSKFERGAPNVVHAFIAWYEWACYEANKGKGHGGHANKHGGWKKSSTADGGVDAEEEEEEDVEEEEEQNNNNNNHHKGQEGENHDGRGGERRHAKMSGARMTLSNTVKERGHIRALLQMCLRHNSSRRKEGQHAFLNHLKAKLDGDVDCHSLQALRDTSHHAVPYALSRLILGMATEDLAMIVLHAHALFLTLRDTALTPAVVLSLLGEELALDIRVKAAKARLEARIAKGEVPHQDGEWDDIDPDKINDPTKGERNQRMIAAVFAMSTVVANCQKMKLEDAHRLVQYLCFTYIEQKATRVFSSNILFKVLEKFPTLWEDKIVLEWLSYAFFLYPKLEYFRPEGVQLLLRIMTREEEETPKALKKYLPPTVLKYAAMDPLQPSAVEQLANALFRKEQVTAVHPMVHPVWEDWFNIVLQRCAAGESMKEHLSTMMHNAIAPYRRGNADAPRRALFQQLVSRLGQLAVQNDDAEQRAEMLQIASKTVGYGRRTIAKPTDVAELRRMPLEGLDAKVRDLIYQYRAIRSSDPSAFVNRTWVLRELRSCLCVPLREGVKCTYVDDAARSLLEFGFFPNPPHRDEKNMNRAIFLFADVFSFTYTAGLSRPKCTLSPLSIIQSYLEAESKEQTRYTTGATHSSFRKARNRIVEALENSAKRSVLFYAERDMHVLLVLLFLVLSTDDPTNEEAKTLAVSTVPDLCQFFLTGTLETLDLFYDVLMALAMRPSTPIHVMPLMTCIRRIATGFMLKFARYIKERVTLNLLLAPLREAYHTDDREKARQAKARGEKTDDNDSSGSDDDDDDDADADLRREDDDDNEESDAAKSNSEGEADSSDDDDDSTSSTSTESTENDDDDTETEVEDELNDDNDGDDDSVNSDNDNEDNKEKEDDFDDDDDDDNDDEEEAPTQQYIDALKGMVGNVDLQFVYPVDTANKEKIDVVRAIQIAARVGASMRSPLLVHIFQVLLAVCRENVKSPDDVIFNSTVSSIQLLMMTKNRYFGRFLVAEDLFQLLSDIQSFCRKAEHVLVKKESQSVRHAVVVRRRMAQLKDVALRVFHFVAFLAYKNHAGEDVRVTLMEFYKSIFCDRGWDHKKRLLGIKRDMQHYRHGYAWALLPAVCEKFSEVEALEGPQRVRVFSCCCHVVEAMLPRLSGVGAALRSLAGAHIAAFLQSTSLHAVYGMKYTLLYDYLHCAMMVLKYRGRVQQMEPAWFAAIVEEAVNDDTLQMSAASIRLLACMERLLGITPRARQTKAPVPVKVLQQQYEKRGSKEKAAFYKRARRVRAKIIKALVAHRNGDLTDAERALKRRRRESMKIDDRLKRQLLRVERSQTLTKEEKEEKRKRIAMAKQERIAKNRERKRRLHEHREKAFQRWREQKLAEAAAAADAAEE
ncbi:uncharacterized protein TM35_000191160 [Trypanosoma theileri]|uniref:Uncharacterized protein n=1 Tax=Trypanosoma theileri TaxID=67003 RepID=A0A1X0NT54_9TRYP|nr:uncharacterized protein TM35_000191160 [Trypanosoma theileri]ORC87872.1 hypothetical protein TM35_000191160 [Trypanosoma theileri]